METLKTGLKTVFAVSLIFWLAMDAISFYSCATNENYKTPWHDKSFLREPVANNQVTRRNPWEISFETPG